MLTIELRQWSCHYIVVLLYILAILTPISHQRSQQWAAELDSPQRAVELANILQITFLGKHSVFDTIYLFESNVTRRRRSSIFYDKVTKLLKANSLTGYAARLLPLRRRKRDIELTVNDPLFRQAWHLNGAVGEGYDMNVQAAWEAGYTGKGVVITILDDGIETTHPDLAENYDELASFDFNDRDTDPMPRYDFSNTNQHGTRCAGQVAAVANNSICSAGVAHNAKIGGVRMLDGKVTDLIEADALSLRHNHIDIYSASWGPPDDGETVDGPGYLARQALLKGILNGRQGKGSIFVWSSGNGGLFEDSCACDGYANSIFTLSISSASERGLKPWYLEECASTIATTYSSGEPEIERQVVTTDLHGGCTDNHTGSSASAPIAAGMVALALEANPNLTWRDIQHIVVETARPEPLYPDGRFMVNGIGKLVSSRFGFGLMDALGMVTLAKTWKAVAEQHICTAWATDYNEKVILPERPLVIRIFTVACMESQERIHYLEHVEARISLWYSIRGDLEIFLTSPSGTRSQLLPPRTYDDKEGEFLDWPFVSVQFWGESPAGRWQLEIFNVGLIRNSGKLRRWSLILYGTDRKPQSTTIHFDEPFFEQVSAEVQNESGDMSKCPIENCAECKLEQQSGIEFQLCARCQPGFYFWMWSDYKQIQQKCVFECPETMCRDPVGMTCLSAEECVANSITMSPTNHSGLMPLVDIVKLVPNDDNDNSDEGQLTSNLTATYLEFAVAAASSFVDCSSPLALTVGVSVAYVMSNSHVGAVACSLLQLTAHL